MGQHNKFYLVDKTETSAIFTKGDLEICIDSLPIFFDSIIQLLIGK